MMNAILLRLMWREALPLHVRIHPEERICIDIANMLRKDTLEGRLKAVWTHIPNEGKRHRLVALVLKAMGLLRGSPDYCFVGCVGLSGGVIEVKSSTGKMSPYQQDYAHWALMLGVRHAVCRSAAEVRATLITWGLLDA